MKNIVVVFFSIVFCVPPVGAVDDHDYKSEAQYLENQIRVLRQRVKAVISELRSGVKNTDQSDFKSLAELKYTVSNLSFRISDIANDENELMAKIDAFSLRDPKIARSEDLKRRLLRQGLFRRKIAKAVLAIQQKIGSAERTLKIKGNIYLGLGQDTLSTSGKSKSSSRIRIDGDAKTRIDHDLSARARLAHNEKAVFTSFRTTDGSLDFNWKATPDLTVTPQAETSSYDDIEDDNKDYSRSGYGTGLQYIHSPEFKAHLDYKSQRWDYKKVEDFNTTNLNPRAEYNWDNQQIDIGYSSFSRANATTKAGDFTTTSPTLKYISSTEKEDPWTFEISSENTKYGKNSAADNSKGKALLTWYDNDSDGGKTTNELSYLTSDYPSNSSLKYYELGYLASRTQYTRDRGFIMDQDQYFYRDNKDDNVADTFTINSLSTKSAGSFLSFVASGSNQNLFHFTLASKKPRSGEQSWEIIYRRELELKLDSGIRLKVGPLLGHKLIFDLGDLDSAQALEDAGGPAVEEGKILLENPLNYYRLGGRARATFSDESYFVDKGKSLWSINLSIDDRTFYHSKPKTSTQAMVAAVNLSTPLPDDLILDGKIDYSKSLSKSAGAKDVTKELTTIFFSVRIPYEQRIDR